MPALTEFAPAKINLTLRIGPLRPDGYHEIESLVVFARPRDRVDFIPGSRLSLETCGPTAGKAGPESDNLVIKAATALARDIPALATGAFVLTKRLPVAAGIGGGSSDAAAALRLLARTNNLALGDARLHKAARATASISFRAAGSPSKPAAPRPARRGPSATISSSRPPLRWRVIFPRLRPAPLS
ncbi:MAG: hypothetical protein HXY30_11405 [Pseudorhodoplanes sp.]|nr:hypothetical protein [Pseudorhodoplanes sp.]